MLLFAGLCYIHKWDTLPSIMYSCYLRFKVLTPWTGSSIMFMIDPDDQYYFCCPDRLHEALLEILPMCVIIEVILWHF